jgi:hypothetical protein
VRPVSSGRTGWPALYRGSFRYDDDGNLTDVYLPGDVDRDGDVDESDMGALLASWGKCEGEQGYNPNADFKGDGCVNQSDFAILLARWGTTNKSLQIRYTWDAENRLVGVEPVFPQTGDDKKVEFTYDYLGRRVAPTGTPDTAHTAQRAQGFGRAIDYPPACTALTCAAPGHQDPRDSAGCVHLPAWVCARPDRS